MATARANSNKGRLGQGQMRPDKGARVRASPLHKAVLWQCKGDGDGDGEGK